MSTKAGRLEIRATPGELAAAIADWLTGIVIATPPPVRICLSGGSTPKLLFRLLAEPARAARMPWPKLQLFWGDERCVPYASPDSNYGEAKRLLLDHVPLEPAQIHPFAVDLPPEQAAERYQQTLQRAYGAATLDPARALFAVNFLGLGEDGHTASLIPGQKVLEERTRWAASVSEGRPEVRLTLTYPVLQSAAATAFLVTGGGKREILRAVRGGEADVPAARLTPLGDVIWFADAAAAG